MPNTTFFTSFWLQRLALSVVLIATGILKFLPESGQSKPFGPVTGQERLLDGPVMSVFGMAEIVLGLVLLSKRWKVGMFATLGLVSLFWAFLLTQIAMDKPVVSCGCLGPIELGLTPHLALVAGMFAVALSSILPRKMSGMERKV